MPSTALVWFRRDLRDYDHAALSAALQTHDRVYCAFCFDTDILAALPRRDRRVAFILAALEALAASLADSGGGLFVLHGRAVEEIPALALQLGADAVFANRDYEPQARLRDAAVAQRLGPIPLHLHKDQVIFETDEVLNAAGAAFSVFTAYKNAWLKRLAAGDYQPHPVSPYRSRLKPPPLHYIPSLETLGFEATDLHTLGVPVGMAGAQVLLKDFLGRMNAYADSREYPAQRGPSYLSAHLRFGTISIREVVAHALREGGRGAITWLGELIWREFYFMILHHHPRVVEHAFKPEYDALVWGNDPQHLAAWCSGRTGYPLMDAAMRQLNTTGYMHNRLRMLTASFLVKDLHVDWRVGERYFAEKLLDYDLAANNGGWQWAASTGCDAQPYFRIFNPVTQSKRFDAEGAFIRMFVPELRDVPERYVHTPWLMNVPPPDYPARIVRHEHVREIALARYKAARQGRSVDI